MRDYSLSESYEKGLKLEELITDLFRTKGYDARHNVKLVGRSGVEHQIDVFAEYKAPLHISKIVIECKSYDKPIDKDIVMKLIHEVQDLGVDRGILVTTSYFTPDAVSTAEGYNIDLWDSAKLNELLKEVKIKEIAVSSNIFHIKPAISIEKAREIIIDRLTGFFGRKGEIESSSILYMPFYEIEFYAKIQKIKGFLTKKIEERIVNASILVDATFGMFCDFDATTGISRYFRLPELSDEEKYAFEKLMLHGSLTVSALASLMSCSSAKARKVLQGLVAKGVANMESYKRQVFYKLAISIPDPRTLKVFSSYVQEEEGEAKKGMKISPNISLETVKELIELLWKGKLKDYKTVYYPYFASKVVEKGNRYVIAVDMQNGKVDDSLSKLLTKVYLQLPF